MAEFYKLEIGAWNTGTDELTLEQEAAFLRVVNAIRLYEQPLTTNLRVLAGFWRCNERKAGRLLRELVSAGKLRVEGGRIINERAVNEASTLRQSRVNKQLAGSLGGIESGKTRRNPLKGNDAGEAPASTRVEERREEKNDDDDCAGEREPSTPATPTTAPNAIKADDGGGDLRERMLRAMGADPISGITGPSARMIGTQTDMLLARKWVNELGLTEREIVAEVQSVMARKPDGAPPATFRYFSVAMQQVADAKAAPQLKPNPTGPQGQGPGQGAPQDGVFQTPRERRRDDRFRRIVLAAVEGSED